MNREFEWFPGFFDQRSAAEQMDANNPMAMVALGGQTLLNLESLQDRLRENWPDADALSDISQSGSVVTFRWGTAVGALTHFPHPMPWAPLEGPCACAWYWPQATDVMRAHREHILVSLVDEGRSRVAKSMRLTQLVAASSLAAGGIGIYWGPGRLVHPPAGFVELARSMTREHLPLELWIDFRVEEQPDGRWRLFTTGLEPLGRRELEVADYTGEANDLRAAVYNVAHYLLDTEKAVATDQTIGISGGPQMIAHVGPSMIDPGQEAIRLEFVES